MLICEIQRRIGNCGSRRRPGQFAGSYLGPSGVTGEQTQVPVPARRWATREPTLPVAPVMAINGVLGESSAVMTPRYAGADVKCAEVPVAEYDGDIMKKTRSLAKPLTWLLIIALVGTVGAGALQGVL